MTSAKSKPSAPSMRFSAKNHSFDVLQVLPLEVSDSKSRALVVAHRSATVRALIKDPYATRLPAFLGPSLGSVDLRQIAQGEGIRIPRTERATAIELDRAGLAMVLSDRTVEHEGVAWSLRLPPETVRSVLRGQPVTVVGVQADTFALFRLIPRLDEFERLAPLPNVDEVHIRKSDVEGFLANPLVPGVRGRPYRIQFTSEQMIELLDSGGLNFVPQGVSNERRLVLIICADEMTEVGSSLSRTKYLWRPMSAKSVGFAPAIEGEATDLAARSAASLKRLRDLHALMQRQLERGGTIDPGQAAGAPIALIAPLTVELVHSGEAEGRIRRSYSAGPEEGVSLASPAFADGEALEGFAGVEAIIRDRCGLQPARGARNSYLLADRPVQLRAAENGALSGEGIRLAQAEAEALVWKVACGLGQLSRQAGRSRVSEHATDRIEAAGAPPDCVRHFDEVEMCDVYKIRVTREKSAARLAVFVPNPLSSAFIASEFIRRNEAVLRNALLEPELAGAFEALQHDRLHADSIEKDPVQTEDAARRDNLENDDDDEPSGLSGLFGRLQRRGGRVEPAQKRTDKEAAIGEIRARIEGLRKLADRLFAPQNRESAFNAVAALADAEAARALGARVGEPRAIDLEGARRWLCARVLEKRYPALAEALKRLNEVSADDTVYAISLISAAVPSEFDLWQIENLRGERGDIRRDCFRPLVAPFVDVEQDHAKLWSLISRSGILAPEDLGLGTAIRQLMEASAALKNEVQALDVTKIELSRRLMEHISANKHYYAFVIFSELPRAEREQLIEEAVIGASPEIGPHEFQREVIGFVGDNLVVPLRSDDELTASVLDSLVPWISDDIGQEALVEIPRRGFRLRMQVNYAQTDDPLLLAERTARTGLMEMKAERIRLETRRRNALLEAGDFKDPLADRAAPLVRIESGGIDDEEHDPLG